MWYLKFHTLMDEFWIPETPSVDLCRDLSRIEAGIKSPTPYALGSNSPPPGRLKRSNAWGMPGGGGMLKLRFDWYITRLLAADWLAP